MSKHEWRKTLFACIRPMVRLVARARFGASSRVYRDIRGPYLVLGNHSYVVDAMLMGSSFVQPLHFVAASATVQGTVGGRVLSHLADPIPVDKAGMDIAGMRCMFAHANAGHSIGLYPEGNITIDGSPLPIERSVAKLAKQLKLTVVLYRTVGGYFKKPKWAIYPRKGKVIASVVRVLTPDEVAALDVDELHRIILDAIAVDAYECQKENPMSFAGKHNAEGIERLLYLCPNCGKAGHFESKGNRFSCRNCHHTYTYDEYGMIHGAPFATTVAWNQWQHQQFALDFGADYGVEGTLYDSNDTKTALCHGKLVLVDGALHLGENTFPLSELHGIVLHDANQLLITVGAAHYRFIPIDVHANILPLLYYVRQQKAQYK